MHYKRDADIFFGYNNPVIGAKQGMSTLDPSRFDVKCLPDVGMIRKVQQRNLLGYADQLFSPPIQSGETSLPKIKRFSESRAQKAIIPPWHNDRSPSTVEVSKPMIRLNPQIDLDGTAGKLNPKD